MEIVLIFLPIFVPVFMMLMLQTSTPTRIVYFNNIRSKYSALTEKHLSHVIAKYDAGLVTVKCDEYTMTFSDGTCVWMANKFYASGKLYRTGSRRTMQLREDSSPGYKTWRELIHIYDKENGCDSRTFLQKRFGKYRTISVKKSKVPELVKLDD